MLHKLPKTIQFLCFFFLSTVAWSQIGIVTGILNGDDGFPIPGVNVKIKNLPRGTYTDFDGKYEIQCGVGDILEFSSIGMKTKEILVTANMLTEDSYTSIKTIIVRNIKSTAYSNALKNSKNNTEITPSIESSGHTYNNEVNFQYDKIKHLTIDTTHVKIKYFKPTLFFETGYNTTTGFKFVKNNNLPELQNIYSQGISINDDLIFQGAETGSIFSYGPKVSNLEFDGSNYQYDNNGQLVSLGEGNGNRAKLYENTLFNTSIKSANHLFFNLNTLNSFLGFDYTYKTEKDLYNIENNKAHSASLKYNNSKNKKIEWKTFIKYNNIANNQPNINGFQNNLLLNSWATPITFNNNEGYILSDNIQRSFSPSAFNNPNWLLTHNNNKEKTTEFVASVKNMFNISNGLKLETKLDYSNNKNTQNFGLPKNTVGFENGYYSNRDVVKNNFNGDLNFKYKRYMLSGEFEINSKINFNHQDHNYQLNQFQNFDAFNYRSSVDFIANDKSLIRNKIRLSNNVKYIIDDIGLILFLGNNSYQSSVQNDKWFLPTFQTKLKLDDLLDINFLTKLSIYSNITFDVNESNLIYGNSSHNSLQLNPTESLQYLAINDLFLDSSIDLEEKQNYEIGIGIGALNNKLTFNATYFNTEIENAVFPVITNNEFQLKNTATIKNKGFEIDFGATIVHHENLYYHVSTVFSKNRAIVSKLIDNPQQIPIAGFSTISKNLIVGESAGVIVGTAYERDENNRMVIDENGFPLVASERKIIGDPTPEFNLGVSNTFRWKDIELNFTIDAQKGGDIWNGTQNTLNYLGTSQQSASEREITNHIFNGVNQQGEENTIPVDFYNPENEFEENKFVRYGFTGVDEDAIEDGSYINLKYIHLSYSPIKNRDGLFIRNLRIGVYANNLFTWSKFNGASPYSSLYGNNNGTALNFFNAPLTSEVGLKINIKI